MLPATDGTERNQDRLSAIHSAGYELMAKGIPSWPRSAPAQTSKLEQTDIVQFIVSS